MTTDKQVQKAVDYSKEQAVVETVKKSVFPNATDSELMLYFHKCQTVGVHPLDGMIFPQRFKDKDDMYISQAGKRFNNVTREIQITLKVKK